MRQVLYYAALVATVTLVVGNARADVGADLRDCPRDDAPAIAEPACTRVLSGADLSPDKRVGAFLYRGSAREGLGNPGGALEDFDAALVIEPENVVALHLRARSLNALKRWDEAARTYDRLIARDARDADAFAGRGAMRLNLGDRAGAVADYGAAIALQPDEPGHRRNRAQALRAIGQDDRALADLENAAALDRSDVAAPLEAASLHHKHERWRSAVEAASEAIRREPGSASAYNTRGDALAQLGQHTQAVADLTEALRLDPSLRVAYVNRAIAQRGLGRDDLAIADLRRAVELFPDWPTARRKLVEVLVEIGKRAEAVAVLDRALQISAGDGRLHAERAELLASLGDLDRATADYGAALEKDGARADWYASRAKLLTARGDKEAALADIDSAIRLVPRSSAYLRERASLLRALGRDSEARAAESRAHEVRDWPTAGEFLFFMSLGLLLSPINVVAGILGGLTVRRASLGAFMVFGVGAMEGAWPILDLLAGIFPFRFGVLVLGGTAALVWWAVGRALRRVLRLPPATPAQVV